VMALAFFLMSRMDPSTSALLQSVYLFILGAGIGSCMQVLVLIVQNTSSFEDLGVATSGVTFFRTIGSSFGAAIFGSLFTNFLHSRIGAALAASGAPSAAANSPEALHRLPRTVAAPIVSAYAASLTQVFLWAVPVALVGFILALFLREVPLRDIGTSATDLGDGFAMPTTQTSEDMLETAIGRLMRGEPGMRLRSIAMRPDCRLDVAELWALLRINRHQRALGIARITDIAEQFGIPYEVLEPTFDRLVRGGYAQRDVDRFWLTPAGTREVDFVSSLLQGWVIDKLTRSPNFQGRPDRAQVEAALNRITHRIVAQPDWDEPSQFATQRLPLGLPR
jgi:hypothetical protein